jgi:Glycosyl hydrolase family 95 catalytic domain/Domain of unknown function (DUF5703)
MIGNYIAGISRFKILIAIIVFPFVVTPTFGADDLIDINYRALVSRADLDYTNPAVRSEEGMPVGNGRMGSLVWTTPSALKFQINRTDVFAEDSTTVSFPQADSDYASGCGYVDINVVNAGDDVFTGRAFHQHLSVYDAVMTAQGKGVTARVLASPRRDVMAVEIEDHRWRPEPINIDLRMLRYAIQRQTGLNYPLVTNHAVMVQTAEHFATSKLDIRDGRILLVQQFREHDFYDSSAVAISVIGRKSKARYLNDAVVQLSAEKGRGKFTILISSAASFDTKQDTGALAARELETAEASGFKSLAAETADWWRDFWTRSFVYMHDPAHQADWVEGNYTYFLYLMGSSSRGDYPPRFGGMLWRTTGDLSRWGSQYWWANTSAYYNNLMPANRLDLMDPMFGMYSRIAETGAVAARQQWGSQGIWIPEITFFNGLETLPDDIAAELQDLMLVRKPYSERSPKFQWWVETRNRHNSRYNFLADGYYDHGHYVVPTKGGQRARGEDGHPSEIFGHCTHILGVGSRIANLFWQRYQYTGDTNWLRDRAYPLIRGSAEFYRNFPNFTKEADGLYHIHHVNNGEGEWNSSDTAYEVACMHMIFPIAIRASAMLGVDEDLRAKWQDINEHLVPVTRRYPGGGDWSPFGTNMPPLEITGTNNIADDTNALDMAITNEAATMSASISAPAAPTNAPVTPQRRRGGRRDDAYGAFVYGGPGAIEPAGPQPELKRRFLGFDRTGGFIDDAGIGGAQIFRNRLRLREGPGAIDAEHLGGLMSGVHSTLLWSAPDNPDGDPQLSVFNRWPDDWDAAFSLLARGAFQVSSAHVNGKIPFVEILSQAGNECVLKNPWPANSVTLYRNGQKAEDISGDLLRFRTAKGETIVLVPTGSKPLKIKLLE